MNKYTRLIKACIAIAVLTPLIASAGYLTKQQLSSLNSQAIMLETQMDAQVSQFPLDTELKSILNKYIQEFRLYQRLRGGAGPGQYVMQLCTAHLIHMRQLVDSATVRVAQLQEALRQTQSSQNVQPVTPNKSQEQFPPIDYNLTNPDTTQIIQFINQGQDGVTNITPPPPIF